MTSGIAFDVIIIGCGPVGAVAANLLGQSGQSVLVLEQFTDAFPLPRAVHLDHEMMRLFQEMDLVDQIHPHTRETQGHMHLGADGEVIRYMGTSGKPNRFGWANDYFFYQPELEATLRAGFKRFANIEFRQGSTVQSVLSGDMLCEVTTGGETFVGRFVIGCDGARSPVRNSLAITLEDLNFEEAWLVVDANVKGPICFPPIVSLPVNADLQQLSVMVCDPRRPATIVPGRGQHRRWEFMLLPGETETDIVAPKSIAALIGPWLKGCDFEIIRTATYKFNARVASHWRKGNVFLAGDAAHQTPPFFGQGMCHGLRDVSNLCFKLDLVLRGLADASLLDTYQRERDPQVRHVIGAAVAAGRYICELDPQKAAARDAEIRERQRLGQDIATAADLIAPYTDGLVMSGAGERFVQPRIDGVLLDDLTGTGFRILGKSAGLSAASERVIAALCMTRFDHPDLGPVLGARTAVLIRPDNYVYGWADDTAALDRILATLAHQLTTQTAAAQKALHA